MPDDGKVVGDEQVGQPELVLQVLQQVERLGAHRDVERGDRLVGDHEMRPHDERARDDDALALAAREGVRVARHVFGPEPDLGHHLGDAVLQFAAVGEPVGLERLADGVRAPAGAD